MRLLMTSRCPCQPNGGLVAHVVITADEMHSVRASQLEELVDLKLEECKEALLDKLKEYDE